VLFGCKKCITLTLMKKWLIIIFCCFAWVIQAQKKYDLPSDSLIKRAKKVYQNDPTLAYDYSKEAVKTAIYEQSELNLGRSYEILGISFDYLGELDSALFYFEKSIKILEKQKEQIYLARTFMSKANSLSLLSKNKEALTFYTKACDIFNHDRSYKEEACTKMGIGNIYSNMKSYELALKYYDQALSYFESSNDSVFVSYMLTNISEVYSSMNNFSKELEYQRKSLQIKERINDDYGLVYSYSNMAGLMAKINKKDSALYYGNAAIASSKKINNQEFLSSSYHALGEVYARFNDYNEALKYYEIAMDLARKIKNPKTEYNLLKVIAEAHIKLGNYKDATLTLEDFILLNDSLNSIENRKSFNELQTQYETDKKEKEISLLNERDKKREVVIYSIIGLSLLLGLLSFVLYNRFRLKKRTASELEIRNKEISNQKHIIEEKQKEITDSIHYAKRIQNTLLAHKDFIDKFIPQNFILFKPKDIVSGDFYWATEHNGKFYIAVCDSTGHGVPGAFMSLLNIGFLSEAIKEKNISPPNEVFNYVRKRLIDSMGKDGQKDGMDAILVCIDTNTKSIIYAAANNEPVLLKNGNYIKLAKDKMPVGQGELIADFTLHTIDYKTGDTLYLYTDGYADQFGGPKGKKFKYKALNDLLESIHHLSMTEQQDMLNQTIANWMGNLEQVDDICIMGIKL
jgi:serine phosphatase RsbU (regulator of sigma subunit)/predicted negative regulator of RcsB-dependent stress response